MYKDIIHYRLAEGVTTDHLYQITDNVLQNWMKLQPGFIKWEIHHNEENSYTDIVHWDSEAAAQNAEAQMEHIPNAFEWFECYEPGSITSEKCTLLQTLK